MCIKFSFGVFVFFSAAFAFLGRGRGNGSRPLFQAWTFMRGHMVVSVDNWNTDEEKDYNNISWYSAFIGFALPFDDGNDVDEIYMVLFAYNNQHFSEKSKYTYYWTRICFNIKMNKRFSTLNQNLIHVCIGTYDYGLSVCGIQNICCEPKEPHGCLSRLVTLIVYILFVCIIVE